MPNIASGEPEKKSRLKNFLGKFKGESKRQEPIVLVDMPKVYSASPAQPEQALPVNEEKPVVSASSPFSAAASIKPIGLGEQSAVVDQSQKIEENKEAAKKETPAETKKEEPKPLTSTDEIMQMLSKAVSQEPAPAGPAVAHEVAFDMKADAGWEAELEKAAGKIEKMSEEQFRQTYGKDIKDADVFVRYNLIEVINDVLKNGNRSHAFDGIVETARGINDGGRQGRLVVVGEFTYVADKAI